MAKPEACFSGASSIVDGWWNFRNAEYYENFLVQALGSY